MASSDDPPEVSGCLVFSIEALCFLIFKRLPVKSLCRFRCVCRLWNSLITSPSFVAERFYFVAPSSAEKSYLLFNGFSADHQRLALYHPHKSPQNQVTYLDYPFRAKRLDIVDVIHGMVCLQPYSVNSVELALLWNPSTHKYLSIPPSHTVPLNSDQSVGFGFQSSKNDFKVVNISYYVGGLGQPVCEVFSLQTGLWVAVASDDSTVGSYSRVAGSACFLNGTIHWIASFAPAQEGGDSTYAILCFDCEHDKLSLMELPQEFFHSPPVVILRYGGKLSVYKCSAWVGALELWVMDEYGVVSTWNKLFRVENGVSFLSVVMCGEDGDILVYDDVQALAEETNEGLGDWKLYLPVKAGVFEESLHPFEQTSQVPRQ